ncbi:helix-turn-helix transcriptional regulator [Thermomonospora cellulosilytica]|uniref:Biotin operon repressor n=1 Tax=Thermomonospora cellulosilytica TaxID=1411118 RepID=A0A7W3N189_9ACTN|nr:WYL domain-containing protein [Thermomonospora cellulosilytica]MBA9005679.1 biotin operon repressor [Thermomonospora cellulosilytica]
MDRADRLLALVAELRAAAPAPVAAAELARRLRVPAATVRRDLQDLTRHGLPVRGVPGRGYALRAPGPPPLPSPVDALAGPVEEALAAAARHGRVVRIEHTGESGERTRRDVEAHGLVIAPYGVYLVGWCRMREGPRVFRVDRIAAAYPAGPHTRRRDIDELLTLLWEPPPPRPSRGPAARARVLAAFTDLYARLAELVAGTEAGGEGAAAARAVLGHLAEWTRWQVAAVRAVATGTPPQLDGDRPAFPAAFDDDLPYPVRERMIQDAMAPRSLAELGRDLHMVLRAAHRWAAGCDAGLWRRTLPDPARPGGSAPLEELLTASHGPVGHVRWHLDRLTGPDRAEPGRPGPVEHCPLRT